MPSREQVARLARRRAAQLRPAIARAFLRAVDRLAERMNLRLLADLITRGDVAGVVAATFEPTAIEYAMQPYRDALRDAVAQSVRASKPLLPPSVARTAVDLSLSTINPRVIAAAATIEQRAVQGLTRTMRETVRQRGADGLAAGEATATIARDLRAVLGLTPTQERAVRNFRRLLEDGDWAALERALRDRRFDGTLRRAFAGEVPLTREQRDAMVDAYRRRSIAHNASVQTRTFAADAQRAGQRAAMETAIQQGFGGDRIITKTWIHLDAQDDPRPEHEAMGGQTVDFEQPYSNGDQSPGDSDPWNCHCVEVYATRAP